MAILYLTEQGATVRLVGGRIVVDKEERIIEELPALKLQQIVSFGKINLTPAVIAFCFEQGADVAFLSMHGKYRGRLQPEMHKSAALRQQQYALSIDKEFCRAVSANIVAGKLRNMAAMIRRQRRLREDGSRSVAELESLLPRILASTSIEPLYGYEGRASAVYLRAWRAALKDDWGFKTRRHHPPGDPVNALLSLGYTLLYNDVYAAINIVGLDPYLGLFHRLRHGHAALASDLMEEHRCVVIDRMVLTALNKRMITAGDFLFEGGGVVRLEREALKRFLQMYASQMMSEVIYPPTGARTTYRQLIEWQVRHLARVVMGEQSIYLPYQVEASREEE